MTVDVPAFPHCDPTTQRCTFNFVCSLSLVTKVTDLGNCWSTFPSKCSGINTKCGLLQSYHLNWDNRSWSQIISYQFTACQMWHSIISICSQDVSFLSPSAPTWLPDPLTSTPYCTVVKSGGVGEFDFQVWILSIWGKSNLREKKVLEGGSG